MPARRRFYQVLDIVLDITLRDDLELENYIDNLRRMYGEEAVSDAVSSVTGSVRFFGLTPTNMRLDGIDKHSRLIASYEKLQVARQLHHTRTSH